MSKQLTPKESESTSEATLNVQRASEEALSGLNSHADRKLRRMDLVNDTVGFIVCLLAAHYIMTYEIGTWRPSKMNVVYMLIAAVFGFDMYVRVRASTAVAMSMGLIFGLISVTGMSGTTWFVSDSPFFAGQQERIDFLVSTTAIMLAYASGNALGAALNQIMPSAFEEESDTLIDTLKKIAISLRSLISRKSVNKINVLTTVIKALTALVLAISAMWVAVKGLFITH
jgi:hypothetical protein